MEKKKQTGSGRSCKLSLRFFFLCFGLKKKKELRSNDFDLWVSTLSAIRRPIFRNFQIKKIRPKNLAPKAESPFAA